MIAPKMLPFFKAVIFYFTFVTLDSKADFWSTLLKCDPIVGLMIFVILMGITTGKEHRYARRILTGLLFSCIGDALLNYDWFLYGMAAFACAQFSYISAFGWSPFKIEYSIPLYGLGALLVTVIFKSLCWTIAIGLPVYTILLMTMCWRCIVRASQRQGFFHVFCAVGSVVFAISDALIAIDMFYQPIPSARYYIMSTYYFAQFAIALSVLAEKRSARRKNEKTESPIHLGIFKKLF